MSWIIVGVSAAVLAVAAGTAGTIAAYQQGRAQEEMYQAEADMAYKQAAAAKEEAQREQELIQDQAAADSKKLRREQLRMLARQKASLAAMGISGVTAEDIIADTTRIQEEDKSTLRWNADTASWEAKTRGDFQSWQYQVQGVLARQSARNVHKQTNIGLVKNILDTGSAAVGAFAGVKGGAKTGGGFSAPQGSAARSSGTGSFSSSYTASGGTGLKAVTYNKSRTY